MMLRALVVVFAALSISLPAGADPLPPGEAMLPVDSLPSFVLFGKQKSLATLQNIVVEGQSFNKALRAQVQSGATSLWNVQIQAGSVGEIKQGDVCMLRFFMRCEESMTSEGQVGVVFEKSSPPNEKAVERMIAAGQQWTEIFVPFTATRDYPKAQSQVCLRLGFDRQTLDIADVQLINFGRSVKLESLPRTRTTYAGREPDAAWRVEAEARIEKFRKGELRVEVRDASGNPVSNADVRVLLKRHAFGFGTCVTADMLTADSEDGRKYRQIVEENYNLAVFENDMKWPALWNGIPPRLDQAMEWLAAGNIRVRGHNLVWPGWRWLPPELKQYEKDPVSLRRITAEHITNVVSHFKGKLADWDVVNEPFSNHELIDLLGGDQVMVEWFQLAHAADPDCRLFLNDFGILDGGKSNEHRAHFHKTLKFLIDNGAPLHGIGIQSHFSADLPSPKQLMEVLDQFSAFGLPIESTELSLNLDDPQLQADYLRDYMTTMFSHPNVSGIMLWGFWQKRHWRPQGALYTDDWTIRPHGQAWLDLVKKKWHTDAQLTTDQNGAAHVRGFLGKYEVTVTQGKHVKTADGVLMKDGTTIKVLID